MDNLSIQEIPVELLLEHPENSNFINVETAQKLRGLDLDQRFRFLIYQ